MAITLKLGEPLYGLYNEATGEYVYLLRGDYQLKPVPKPSGLAPTIEKIQQKHAGLLKLLDRRAKEGDPQKYTDDEAYEMYKNTYHGRAQFDKIRADNFRHTRLQYRRRYNIAKRFIIVKLSVEKADA